MTDFEWLECGEPDAMEALLESLGRLTERKRRLFACGLCRRNAGLIRNNRCMRAISCVERSLDGDQAAMWLALARNNANSGMARCRPEWEVARHARLAVVCLCSAADARQYVQGNLRASRAVVDRAAGGFLIYESESESRRVEAGVLRELHGNPSRPIGLDPSWVTLDVAMIALSIVDGMDLARLPKPPDFLNDVLFPKLAMALEGGGCRDEQVLDHCRSGGRTLARLLGPGRRARQGLIVRPKSTCRARARCGRGRRGSAGPG